MTFIVKFSCLRRQIWSFVIFHMSHIIFYRQLIKYSRVTGYEGSVFYNIMDLW